MEKQTQILITDFNGGISEDKRSGWVGNLLKGFTTNRYSITKHFDVFSFAKKLVPYHKTVADENKAYNIVKFLYAPWLSAGAYRLYGLGIVTTTKAKIYQYDVDAGTFAGWETPTKGESTVAGRNTDVFFYYKNYIYVWAGGTVLTRFHTTNGDAYNDAYQTLTYTSVAQPVLHPADDIAYFFYNNNTASYVCTLNDTSWTSNVLTLSADQKIVAACPYGNYLAIGCVTRGSLNVRSTVYLWDRDSSLTTLTERIDFGEGTLKHLANLNNKLIAIVSQYVNNDYGLDRGRILIKQASGNFATTINELTLDDTVADLMTATSYIKDNKIYFPASPKLNGDSRLGIWAIDEYGRASLDFVEEEATQYDGIFLTGNMWWIAHSGDGSVNRTTEDYSYSTTNSSIYESLIFNAGNSELYKKLVSVSVMTEKMPTAGQIVLKYRIDGATSWTTIYTDTTNSQISHKAINIEATGVNLPEFKEIEFQINSTGGAVVTGFKAVVDIYEK